MTPAKRKGRPMRNSMEKIMDFPYGNEAELIHSLQIHPQGWCAVTRNTSKDNESEWTCVHDIQNINNDTKKMEENNNRVTRRRIRTTVSFMNDMRAMEERSRAELPYDLTLRLVTRDPMEELRSKINTESKPRLTNYTQETNRDVGFIKEICFSPDGRIICSPYDKGVRLLMFNDKCSELSHCVPKTPRPLITATTSACHDSCVVSAKFSPFDSMLVSGSLGGEIIWHEPLV